MLTIVDDTVSETAILHLQNGFILPPQDASAAAGFQHTFHRDFPRHLHGYVASLNVMLTLDAFTAANGGTLVVPGTHQRSEQPEQPYLETAAIAVDCPAGSMIVFDSTLWHAAGANRSGDDRLAINHQFTRSFLKQQIDYVRALGDELVLEQPPRVQQLLGWYTRVVTSLDEYYRPADEHLYVSERLAARRPGTFVEVGVGSGHLSQLLLSEGWTGTGWDLRASSLLRASRLNAEAIATGNFTVRNADWLSGDQTSPVDLVVSSMVLEHLDDAAVDRYFERAAASLGPGGLAILLVPGSPRHWGIEDEIAGHHRRYTAYSLQAAVRRNGWHVDHLAGLCYPLSNVLLRLSDRLVGRAEKDKRALTLLERTERSGDREVAWKTDFPGWAGLLINETVLKPFHWWQKRSVNAADALVLYCECSPR
jgi:SAM-dependent methyltransferase